MSPFGSRPADNRDINGPTNGGKTELPLGANSPALNLNNVGRAQNGTYFVTVTDVSNGGSTVSSNAVLKVLVPQLLGSPTLLPDGTFQLLSTDANGGLLSAFRPRQLRGAGEHQPCELDDADERVKPYQRDAATAGQQRNKLAGPILSHPRTLMCQPREITLRAMFPDCRHHISRGQPRKLIRGQRANCPRRKRM